MSHDWITDNHPPLDGDHCDIDTFGGVTNARPSPAGADYWADETDSQATLKVSICVKTASTLSVVTNVGPVGVWVGAKIPHWSCEVR